MLGNFLRKIYTAQSKLFARLSTFTSACYSIFYPNIFYKGIFASLVVFIKHIILCTVYCIYVYVVCIYICLYKCISAPLSVLITCIKTSPHCHCLPVCPLCCLLCCSVIMFRCAVAETDMVSYLDWVHSSFNLIKYLTHTMPKNWPWILPIITKRLVRLVTQNRWRSLRKKHCAYLWAVGVKETKS